MKRLFHPTLNAWKDVPESDVEKWVKAGWLKSRPKHADDTDSHKPGEFHSAPVAVDPAPEKPTKSAPAKAEEKSGK